MTSPKRIAVLSPQHVPPMQGGAERLFGGLTGALHSIAAATVEHISLPSPEATLAEIVGSYRTWSELDLSRFDVVISGKYPTWAASHPHHIVYMLHRLRGLYETYPVNDLGTEWGAAAHRLPELHEALQQPPSRSAATQVIDLVLAAVKRSADDHDLRHPGPVARSVVRFLDASYCDAGSIERFAAISNVVAGRREYFPANAPVIVAHPPSDLAPAPGVQRRHFLAVSRLDAAKRIGMIVEGYRASSCRLPLKVVGSGPELDHLRGLAGGDRRIEFLGRVTDDELRLLYGSALAVPFFPYDEDFGYITLEAQLAGALVLSSIDSGGAAELIEHGRTGLLIDPHPAAIGQALESIERQPVLSGRIGARARETALSITWERVVTALLATPDAAPITKSGKVRLVALSTYPLTPITHGGQVRAFNLYSRLAEQFDVHAVCLAPRTDHLRTEVLAPDLRQTVVPISPEHFAADEELRHKTGFAVTDVAMSELIHLTPAYLAHAQDALAEADLAMLTQGYMGGVLQQLAPHLPFVYESHNAESHLKAAMLGAGSNAGEMRSRVEAIERQAVRDSILVTCCAAADQSLLERQFGPVFDHFHLAPNGVDTHALAYRPPGSRNSLTRRLIAGMCTADAEQYKYVATFVGSNHPPNVAAANVIIDAAPHCPEVLFILAGGHSTDAQLRRLPPNVRPTGAVSRFVLDGLLQATTIGLNPMLEGSGTNLKMLEYFALGIPVVSSSVGVRGLGAGIGHVALAEPRQLADAVNTLVRDEARQLELSIGARRLAEDRFDWDAIAGRMAAAIAHAMAARHRAETTPK